jgi:hypothetical protein
MIDIVMMVLKRIMDIRISFKMKILDFQQISNSSIGSRCHKIQSVATSTNVSPTDSLHSPPHVTFPLTSLHLDSFIFLKGNFFKGIAVFSSVTSFR